MKNLLRVKNYLSIVLALVCAGLVVFLIVMKSGDNKEHDTDTALNQANTNYALLENRLRRDVAERLVIQRKFYNRAELQAQLDTLKNDPFTPQISEHSIYAGLDVEVQSNSVHVISPD